MEANASLSTPLTLDYEYNDPADAERLYSRSDHVSYASNGIPVIGFTTGMHRDYHRVTDSVDRINFPSPQGPAPGRARACGRPWTASANNG